MIKLKDLLKEGPEDWTISRDKEFYDALKKHKIDKTFIHNNRQWMVSKYGGTSDYTIGYRFEDDYGHAYDMKYGYSRGIKMTLDEAINFLLWFNKKKTNGKYDGKHILSKLKRY